MNAVLEKGSGKLIGHCGLLIQKVDGIRELEIGYGLLPRFWGKGYATEAVRVCIAFQRNLADSLISIMVTSNLKSERVCPKKWIAIGEGKHLSWNPRKYIQDLQTIEKLRQTTRL